MSKKIKVNIPNFGEKYCSDNVEHRVFSFGFYRFFKKGTYILHNEYGPAEEWNDGSYFYYINYSFHRLNGPAIYDSKIDNKEYWIIDKYIRNTHEGFIKNMANILIPRF